MKTLPEQLREKGLSDTSEPAEKTNRKKQIHKESLSDIDWADLMGSNRETFRRVKGGAIRRNR